MAGSTSRPTSRSALAMWASCVSSRFSVAPVSRLAGKEHRNSVVPLVQGVALLVRLHGVTWRLFGKQPRFDGTTPCPRWKVPRRSLGVSEYLIGVYVYRLGIPSPIPYPETPLVPLALTI